MILIANKIFSRIIVSLPILILFVVTFSGSNLNFIYNQHNFTINLIYIIIFFWSLKNPDHLGYGFIFIAGIINDVIQDFPIGISSLDYLLISVIAAFMRNRIVFHNFFYDWTIFFITILIVGSINYVILVTVFKVSIIYNALILGLFITFLIYPIFSKLFAWIDNMINTKEHDK